MFAQIDEIALFVHNCEYIVSSLVSKNKSNNVYSWEKRWHISFFRTQLWIHCL